MKRVRELPDHNEYRMWWLSVREDIRNAFPAPYNDYFTPEQLADLREYGMCFFVAEDGSLYRFQCGQHPHSEPNPHLRECIQVQTHLAGAFLAKKLLYQSNVAGARAIAGHEGAVLQ